MQLQVHIITVVPPSDSKFEGAQLYTVFVIWDKSGFDVSTES
jgi:hypothetical protein